MRSGLLSSWAGDERRSFDPAKEVTASATLTQYRGAQIPGAAVAAAGNGFPAAVGGVSGDLVPLVILGAAIGEAGGLVATGALLEFDSVGRYITRSAGAIAGRALSAASGAGVQIQVLVIPNWGNPMHPAPSPTQLIPTHRRCELVNFLVSPAEHELLRQVAEDNATTISALIRCGLELQIGGSLR